jgi:hypothetical protein
MFLFSSYTAVVLLVGQSFRLFPKSGFLDHFFEFHDSRKAYEARLLYIESYDI